MTRVICRIALLGTLVVACGKYGPPRRVHNHPREVAVEATENSPAEAAPAAGDDEENSQ